MATIKLTKTQQAFFDLMVDGQRHSMQEFINLLPDELSGNQGVRNHMCALRKAMNGVLAEEVICEFVQRRTTYRRVRKLLSGGE